MGLSKSTSKIDSMHENESNLRLRLPSTDSRKSETEISDSGYLSIDADDKQLQGITTQLENMYYKLTDRADDRRKLLQTGESYHKLSGLVLEILKDLKDKYSESIQNHNLQTAHGFNKINNQINNFSSSDANSS